MNLETGKTFPYPTFTESLGRRAFFAGMMSLPFSSIAVAAESAKNHVSPSLASNLQNIEYTSLTLAAVLIATPFALAVRELVSRSFGRS